MKIAVALHRLPVVSAPNLFFSNHRALGALLRYPTWGEPKRATQLAGGPHVKALNA
jgi:hypothetical protein